MLLCRYVNGALALGSSYRGTHGSMAMVVLVTPEVPLHFVQQLATMWQVLTVDPLACNHKFGSKVSAAVRRETDSGDFLVTRIIYYYMHVFLTM